MAEIKNTFLKGKMNQDLDSRIVPNGEYREAIDPLHGQNAPPTGFPIKRRHAKAFHIANILGHLRQRRRFHAQIGFAIYRARQNLNTVNRTLTPRHRKIFFSHFGQSRQ